MDNNELPEFLNALLANDNSRNKYDNKAIKFLDQNTHYELIFTDNFVMPSKFNTVITDILLDLKNANKEKELHIFINSYGGEISTLVSLLQQISEFEHVVTIAMGDADSAGFLLWCVGHERYCSPYSALMYHSISTYTEGKVKEVSGVGDYLSEQMKLIAISVGIENILTPEEISKGDYTEVWFMGEELIKRGKAKDYKEYKNRPIVSATVVIDLGDVVYKKDVNTSLFVPYVVSKDAKTFSYSDILKLLSKKQIHPSDIFNNISNNKKQNKKAR